MNAPFPGFGTSGVTSTERTIEHFGGATGSSAFTVYAARSPSTAAAAFTAALLLAEGRATLIPAPLLPGALRSSQILRRRPNRGNWTKVRSDCGQARAQLPSPAASSSGADGIHQSVPRAVVM